MDKREVIRKVVNHQPVDEVPRDLGGGYTTGIQGEAYRDLVEHLGLDEPVKIWERLEWGAVPSEQVLQWAGGYCIDPYLNGARQLPEDSPEEVWKEYTRPTGEEYLIPRDLMIDQEEDGREVIRDEEGTPMLVRSKSSYYFDDYPVEYFPLKDVADLGTIEALPDTAIYEPWTSGDFARLERNAKWFYENTDYAITPFFGGSLFALPTHLRGYENFLLDLKRNPEYVKELEELLVQKHLTDLKPFIEAVDDYAEIIGFADDLGQQDGPLLSPDDFRELIFPYMKRVYDYVHQHSDLKVYLHSDGAIQSLIPSLIEAGVDILNPVQFSAKGMDLNTLKQEYGDELVFWGGGVDTQNTLPNAKPAEVKRQVKENIRSLHDGSGYVFAQVHNIQPGVPPVNIEAMYEAVDEINEEGV